jgi:hypothetical protein
LKPTLIGDGDDVVGSRVFFFVFLKKKKKKRVTQNRIYPLKNDFPLFLHAPPNSPLYIIFLVCFSFLIYGGGGVFTNAVPTAKHT